MTTNPHLQSSPVLFGAPLESARLAVILVHGRTQSPAEMDEQLVRRIALPDVAYLAPPAADRTWYPAGFMAPLAENQPRLSFALDCLGALSDDLATRGWPAATQVLMGFSQGACLSCELVLRRRQRFGALIAFTGGFIGPDGARTEGDEAASPADAALYQGMPVLLGGDDADSWVPATRMQETAALFQRLGAGVSLQLHHGIGHRVSDPQIEEARAVLRALPGR